MKPTKEDIEYIARKIREDFDSSDYRFRSDFHRYEYRMELIERAYRFGLVDLVNEMKSDLRVKLN